VEFIQDPSVPVPTQSSWLAYYHGSTTPEELQSLILSNLHAIHGNTAYLIQRGGTAGVNFPVSGEPVVPRANWKPNSFNLTGFHLAAGSEPTYSDFFSSSPAHAGQEVWVLRNNAWEKALATEPMQQGEAFWVFCQGSSQFSGPLGVSLEIPGGLLFGTQLDEQDLVIDNDGVAAASVTITPKSAFSPLHYWHFDTVTGNAEWIPAATPLNISIPPGESQRLRFGVKRDGLAEGATELANLEISDGAQRILVPASVTGIGYAGLWVGHAAINRVSEVRKGAEPLPTGTTFSFRLIVHVDEGGQAHLLSQVIQMWQEGTWKPDPENLGKEIVDQPGHFVLLTKDSLVDAFDAAAMLDGRLVGRRVSSSAFGFADPVAMSGTFGPDGDLVVDPITIDRRTDRLNPFVHRYHPKHFTPAQDESLDWSHADEEMFTLDRNITLQFRDHDADGELILGANRLSWGSSTIGGVYSENIDGLHRNTIAIKGTFLLRRVSDVKTLTTTAP
jgi:hypothetical protein